MISVMGINYLTDKEASMRYGYSIAWFRKMRSLKLGPHYIQMMFKGKVLYPLDATDEWFKARMKEKE
jgi:hypothetical protein